MPTVAIADQLKVLTDVQALDSEIYQARQILLSHPEKKEAIKEEQEKEVEHLQQAEERYTALELKKKDKEISLEESEGKIAKYQGQLMQIKTNKEYTAMLKEIEGAKADKSVLEEDVLMVMDEVDQAKAQVTNEKKLVAEKEAEHKKVLDQMDQETAELEKSIQDLNEKRSGILPNIDAKILAQYERILVKKQGVALVPVRNGACSGCNMVLPPQEINEIQMATRLIMCESCARILYPEPNA